MKVDNAATGLKKDRVEALHDAIYDVSMTRSWRPPGNEALTAVLLSR